MLVEECRQALHALESLKAETHLCPDQRSLLRRVGLDLLTISQSPRRMLDGPANPAVGEAQLSPREREVAEWIAKGLTDAEIAAILGLSTRTVNSHRDRVLRKLNVRSRSSIASWVARGHSRVNGS